MEPPPSPHGGGGRLLHRPGHADVHLLHLLPPLLLHHLPRHLPPALPALPGAGPPGCLGPGLPQLQPPGDHALLVWGRHCSPNSLPGEPNLNNLSVLAASPSFCQTAALENMVANLSEILFNISFYLVVGTHKIILKHKLSFLQIIFGLFNFAFLQCYKAEGDRYKSSITTLHKSFGITIFLLAVASAITGVTQTAQHAHSR